LLAKLDAVCGRFLSRRSADIAPMVAETQGSLPS
jgi:hypothetical protein